MASVVWFAGEAAAQALMTQAALELAGCSVVRGELPSEPECVVAPWTARDDIQQALATRAGGHEPPAFVFLADGPVVELAADLPANPLVDLVLIPVRGEALVLAILRALQRRTSLQRLDLLPRSEAADHVADGLVGASPELARVIEGARQVAASPNTSVLIEGESGTGKELIARLIHRRASASQSRPFVDLNCAAIPADLLEAELFGYERGAFTQAARQKPGLMEVADGGTLFLDEVGELNIALQAKLLRALETQSFRRLGGLSTKHAAFRVVASTNRDLLSAVQTGFFRLDLYHRLAVFTIRVPPLRERTADIMPLATYFLRRFADATKKRVGEFSPAAQALLLEYQFPGNVRELKNIIERSVIVETGHVITPRSLALDFGRLRTDFAPPPPPLPPPPAHAALTPPATPATLPPRPAADAGLLTGSLADHEQRHIEQALRQLNGNRVQAARLLGISVPTLYAKMKKYGLVDVGR